jgi:hypothetical protein
LFKLISSILIERASGTYKKSPFFVPETGQPIAVPTVLTLDERQALRSKL